MKRKDNVNQHYIPQLYLRSFTDETGILFVYDMERKNEYREKPAKVAYGKYFHDVKPDILERVMGLSNEDEQFVDNHIRDLHEKIVSYSIKELAIDFSDIDETHEGRRIAPEIMSDIVAFIVIHMIRTPEYRARIKYLITSFCLVYGVDIAENFSEQDILQTIHNLIIYGLVLSMRYGEYKFPAEYERFFGHILDELCHNHNQLIDSSKLVLVNRSSIPFSTSESPIIVNYDKNTYMPVKALVTPMRSSGRAFDIGAKNDIQRVFFPLSKSLGIYFFEDNYAESIGFYGLRIGIVDEWNNDIALNLNLANAARCSKRVFSSVSFRKEIEDAMMRKKNVEIALRF